MTLFYVFFLPVTLLLGFWQIQRGDQKSRLEAQYFETQGALPMRPDDAALLAPFTRVRLEGRYDPERYLFVDNQTRGGRVGYTIVSIFESRDGRTYVVNRGWLPGGPDRSVLPDVVTPAGDVVVTGTVWKETGLTWRVGSDDWDGHWPARIQYVDFEHLRTSVGDLVPAEIRLEPGAVGAFDAAWTAPDFAPQRHYGYALQWFLLAAVLTVLYVHFGLRRAR